MAEVAEERPKDCYAMYTRSAKQGFAVWTLLTVWLAGTTTRTVEFEIATDAVCWPGYGATRRRTGARRRSIRTSRRCTTYGST